MGVYNCVRDHTLGQRNGESKFVVLTGACRGTLACRAFGRFLILSITLDREEPFCWRTSCLLSSRGAYFDLSAMLPPSSAGALCPGVLGGGVDSTAGELDPEGDDKDGLD